MTPAHYIIPYDFLSVRVVEALEMSWNLNTQVRVEARVGVPWNSTDCWRAITERKVSKDPCHKVGSASPARVQVSVLPVLTGYQQRILPTLLRQSIPVVYCLWSNVCLCHRSLSFCRCWEQANPTLPEAVFLCKDCCSPPQSSKQPHFFPTFLVFLWSLIILLPACAFPTLGRPLSSSMMPEAGMVSWLHSACP